MRTLRFILLLVLPTLLRAQTPGIIDSSFASNGWATLNHDDYDAPVAMHATTQRFVIAANTGHADSTGYDMDVLLAACRLDGTPDPSFGQNGIIRLDFPGQTYSTVTAMTAMPDGGYAVLGYGLSPATAGTQHFCIFRTDSLGSAVSAFGQNGHVDLPFIGTYNIPEAIAVQPDGKLLVVGSTYDSTQQHIEYPCIARLNGDGSLDTSFGGTGQLLLNYATGLNAARVTHSNGGSFYDVDVLADGRILCAGSALGSSGYNCALLMLLPDGRADSSFYDGGVLTWDNAPGCNNYVQSVAVLAEDNIALQVRMDCWYLDDDHYYQHLHLGEQPGELINLDGGYAEQAGALLDDGRGHLYFTGPSKALGQPNGWYSDRYSLCRVEAANGNLDLDFGAGGWFSATPNAPEQSGAEALAAQADGKLLVAGFVNSGEPGNLSDIVLVRLFGGLAVGAAVPVSPSELSIVAYPNPCRGYLNVRGGYERCRYSLVGMDGRIVRTWDAVGDAQLDIQGISEGCYLLQAVAKEGVGIVRVVVE